MAFLEGRAYGRLINGYVKGMEVLEKIKTKEYKNDKDGQRCTRVQVRQRFRWMMVNRYFPLKVDVPLSIKKWPEHTEQGGKRKGWWNGTYRGQLSKMELNQLEMDGLGWGIHKWHILAARKRE